MLSAINSISVGKNGDPGTLLLSGSSNLSGPITISGGTLWSQVNGTLSSNITVDPNTGGFLKVQPGTTLTLSGSLSGYPLDVGGGGTVILTGSANAVSIGSGTTFQVGNGGTSGSLGSSNIINGLTFNNGTLIYNHSDNVTVPMFITGGGTLVQAGSGTLFVATSSAARSAIISSGTMALIGAGSITNGPGGVIDNAIFDISGIAAADSIIGSFNGNGLVVLGSKNLFILTGGGTFSGAISGNGGVKLGMAGTQVFSGANTYTGGTTIFSGATLQIGGGGTSGSIMGNVINDGAIIFNRSDAIAFTGIISGGGSVTHAGSGTLTLTGANTYTGGTTIGSGSTLQIGNGGASGSITGNVADNGFLIFNRSGAISLGGVISGAGGVIQRGNGTLTLTGVNTYTGSTSVLSGATLALSGSGSVLSASQVFVSGGPNFGGIFDISNTPSGASIKSLSGDGNVALGSKTLTITGAFTTFSGVISGSGGITIASGTQTISAAGPFAATTDFTGSTTINSGASLALNSGGKIAFSNQVIDNGSFDISGTTGITVNALSGSGTVILGSSPLSLANEAGTFSGAIGGSASVTLVSGSLLLSGTNTYTGATSVSAGSTLKVNGSIANSAVTVASGATLNGTGTVGATTIQNGGTLAPGNSIGTLTVNGNLTLASGATYNAEVSPIAADRTNVTGTASLNGTVAASVASGTYSFGQRFTLINATGGVSGSFASLTGIPLSLKGQFSYDTNNAYLTLSPNALAPLLTNPTGNQQKLVSAIDAAVAAGNVPPGGFVALYGLSGSPFNNALDQISGQAAPNVINAVGNSFLSFMSMTAAGGSGDIGDFAPGSAYGKADAPHRAQLGSGEMRVWGAAYGGHVGLSGDTTSGAAGLSSNNVGMIGGADMKVADGVLAGVTLGLGRQLFHSGNGSGDSSDFMFGLYGRAQGDAAYVTASFGFGRHQIKTLRVVTVSGTDVLQGKQNADDFGGRVETGWHLPLDDAYTVTPYGAFAGESFESPAYAETALSGASTFALSYAAQTTTLGRTELGAHLDRRYALEQGTLTADLRAAWAHQLDDQPFTQASFQGLAGSAFQVAGVRPDRDTALLGLDLEVQNTSGLFFGIHGEGQFGAGTTMVEGLGNFGWRW